MSVALNIAATCRQDIPCGGPAERARGEAQGACFARARSACPQREGGWGVHVRKPAI